jgi:hypothetical protein
VGVPSINRYAGIHRSMVDELPCAALLAHAVCGCFCLAVFGAIDHSPVGSHGQIAVAEERPANTQVRTTRRTASTFDDAWQNSAKTAFLWKTFASLKDILLIP